MAESQLRKGAIELVVLGLLRSAPSYGGELIQRLAAEAGLEVSEGTLYPLLARLKKAGHLDTEWEESPSGPPRKIYRLSSNGHERLGQLETQWHVLNQAVARATRTDSEG